MMIKLEMTIPPSDNKLYRSYRGRVIKSEVYRDWISRSLYELSSQIRGLPTIDGEYGALFIAQKPDNRVRDVTNLIKAASDILKTSNVVKDDKYMVAQMIMWAPEQGSKLTTCIFHANLIGDLAIQIGDDPRFNDLLREFVFSFACMFSPNGESHDTL